MSTTRRFYSSLLALPLFSVTACAQPPERAISGTLRQQDSLLFVAALQTCDLTRVGNILDSTFVYQQDKGESNTPTLTGRAEFIANLQKRCARKDPSITVRRVLVSSHAVLVSPSTATQLGVQEFYVSRNGGPGRLMERSHFTRMWTLEDQSWRIRHELDYNITASSSQDAAQDNDPLYHQVTRADSLLFAAYNHKDLDALKTLFARDLEFFHDKGGLTDYAQNIANFDQHFKQPEGFARRVLVPGSVKVYPLANYGALETGIHQFYTRVGGNDQLTATADFINIWHWVDNRWVLSRVISYAHR